jgi:hypothetical protein
MGIFPCEIVSQDIPFKKKWAQNDEISAGSYEFQLGQWPRWNSFSGVNDPADPFGGVNVPAEILHEIFELFHNFVIS